MQHTLLIIVVEFFLFLLVTLIVIVIMNWRRKSSRHAALEHLIDAIKAKQALRTESIAVNLSERYRLDKQLADELSAVLISTEKRFIAQFVADEMQGLVDDFYENLCGLLDSYVNIIPESAINYSQSLEKTPLQTHENLKDEARSETGTETEGGAEPEWGDVFD